jgi:hypothetical protein
MVSRVRSDALSAMKERAKVRSFRRQQPGEGPLAFLGKDVSGNRTT